MKKDDTFKWDDKEFVDFYAESANVIILERQRCLRLLLEIAAFHFKDLSGLNILDLGCGDGIITKSIHNRWPGNNFFLVDGSEEMLKKARANFHDGNMTFRHRTFEDHYESQSEDCKYDLVVSANAIHHLDIIRKKALFTKIYKELKFGGLFLNVDPVHPRSKYSEDIQFELWRNWMNRTLKEIGSQDDIGRFDGIPSDYKDNAENKPSGLWEQLDILTKCGFRDADCFFKYSIFAVFGGTKQ